MRGLSASESAGPPAATAPLSAILITRNEEANLADCIASLAFAREIVVVDSGSTDRTVAIAEAAGCKVVCTPDFPGFGPQKNRALELATQDWVLSIDADERVTPQLAAEIVAIANAASTPHDAWEIPRSSSYCGQFMRHGGWYPDPVLRLFRRGTARFSDDLVHERVVATGSVGRLRNDLVHYSFRDLDAVLDKVNRYSTAGAQRMHAQGKRSSPLGAVLHGLWAFIRTYLLKAGFLDGRMGLALAISNAEGTYYRYLKLWLMRRQG